ncbi:hypothetical protein LTR37_008649 [Vermiconidia calcicola]|uniref:Uncharacterized protein n=1 Tax=Vermiconidia calcicola TaxID=1690605 RepID=A0ACC3NCY0_9PEZI|nr:hypothetical protein LTR37_008649 [Vermiconidia calcicola]
MNEEQRINICKTGLNQIYSMLRSSPQNWRDYVQLARSVIAHLDQTTFMMQASRTTEQAWMVSGLQRLASSDTDNGGIPDLAAWCSQQWMIIYQRDAQNVAASRGIGQGYIAHAQPVLARIHRADASSSSSGGSSQQSARSLSASEDERQSIVATAEAEKRAGTQDYVEARSLLQPATEYFERAVAAATEQRVLSGDLLATTAEAYMSLGNTSSPRVNERYFRRAVQLLRAASQIGGYSLSRYLQQYLEDYGKLLD